MKLATLRKHIVGIAASLAVTSAIVYSAPAFDPSVQPFGYAPPLAITGFDVSTGSQQVYQTWFDPNVWRGDLVSYNVASNGGIDANARNWYASDKLAAQDWDTGRRVVTRSNGSNVAFRWNNLTGAQQTSIGDNSTGPKILNFVRGDRSNEKAYVEVAGDGTTTTLSGSASGIFRARRSVLGDIVHGRPLYVGAPPASYTFDAYDDFKSANASRPGVVYVGANDGMLHAFDAVTGSELFAYIPSMLVGSLKNLTSTVDPFPHTYFVDGGLAVGDVNLGSSGSPAWRSVLVGGLGAGGKGLFALNVTSATQPDETAAAAKIMWEITSASAGFADLGYVYGDPLIVRLNNGNWAAIVGNGYNNSGSGKSVLYVINIADGTLVKSLTVGNGSVGSPGGLSSPTAIDTNADGKVDFVYAGDVDGKMWKFDLRNANAANWNAPGTPLYTAPMPIVVAPDVAGHPLGGFMVYFGTGQLFTPTNASDKFKQNYVYGIWDGAPNTGWPLLAQTLTETTWGADTPVRTSSASQIDWKKHRGWQTALPLGEDMITPGFIRDGRYQFSTVNTSTPNAIKPDGSNWLMELDYLNGGTDGSLVFDLDANKELNDVDKVPANGTSDIPNGTAIPVGVALGSGLYSQPLLALVSPTLATTLFNRNAFVGPGPACTVNCTPTDGGVAGGHFDFDVYAGANVASFKHTHRYDDKFNVTGANFLNASDPIYNLANPSVSGNRVNAASQFFVLISNGDLSPGVTLTVGGTKYKAYQYPNKFDGTQDVFTPASSSIFQFEMPVDAFSSKDWGTGVVRAGLMPTATGCVKSYPALPGQFGEVHNGALTIWVVRADAPASAIALNVANHPEKGYKVIDDTYVLKKYTVFWHNGACYGQSGWVPNPPLDSAGNPLTANTPAPGSEDPRGVPTQGVLSVSTVTTPPANKNGNTTITTTTIYANGSGIIVTTVINNKGKVVSTTTKILPPGQGGVPPGQAKKNQASAPPPPVRGYNQSRKSGKVGRIAWHELVKD